MYIYRFILQMRVNGCISILHTNTHMRTCANTHTHTHTHIHACTHTHTHVRSALDWQGF